MPVEVSCPGCSAKLKAPENMIGKKAKCKKCFTSFRIPGPAGTPDSVGESQMLSVVSAPTPPLPPAPEDIPMAGAVEDDLPVEPPPSANAARMASPPTPDVAALPSADPFDFTAPAPKSLQPPKAPSGSRPGVSPPRTAPYPPAPPKTLPPPPAPAPAAPEVLSLDDAEPLPIEEPVVESGPPATSDDPFSFAGDAAPAVEEPRAKGKPKKKGSDEAKGVQPKGKKTQPVAEAIEEPVEEPVGFAAAATSDDPFSFSAGPPAPDEKQKESPRSKKKAKNEDEEEPQEGNRRYQRAGEKKSRTLLIAIILGVLALGGAVAAAFVFMNRKEAEPPKKSTEKKEEPPPPEAPKEEKKDEPKDKPKDKKDPPRKNPPKKDPSPKTPGDPVSGSPVAMLALPPKLPTFQFRPLPPKVETAQQPSSLIQIEAPYEKIKRFFPSDKRTQDSVVVWQSSPGISGVGERLTADSYSGTTGSRVGRLEFEGDGKEAKCSLSHDSQFFAAAAEGKVNVWKLGDKPAKVLDAFDPYADKTAHKKAGLAAVFLPNNPNHLVTVTSAGVIHLFDIASKQQLGEYVPENGVSGRVSVGKSVAIDEDGTSVVVAAGGAIHQVATATPPSSRIIRSHSRPLPSLFL
jgi:hypothetical protein